MTTGVSELLVEGLSLMFIGMGIVVSFLLVLVGVLVLMSKAVLRWAPDAPLGGGELAARPHVVDDRRLIAVISAAVTRYRKQHRRS